MPIYKIGRDDFPLIDWQKIKAHLQRVYEFVETDISLFTGGSASWFSEVDSQWTDHKPSTVIICQFWLNHEVRRQRPKLDNPTRAGFIMRHEKEFIRNFLNSITNKYWLNLKAVWYYPECKDGIITIHFKVNDYEPFLKK